MKLLWLTFTFKTPEDEQQAMRSLKYYIFNSLQHPMNGITIKEESDRIAFASYMDYKAFREYAERFANCLKGRFTACCLDGNIVFNELSAQE